MQTFHNLLVWRKAHASVLHVDTAAADLRKARAAGRELEHVFLLCRHPGFFSLALNDELHAELTEVGKMISGLFPKLSGLAEPVR